MSNRIIGEHYVENSWTCTNCRIVNRGRDMRCESCDSPRDKSEMVDGPPGSQPVTDPELLRKAKAGPNRLCPFCDSQNRAIDGKCPECGAARVNAEKSKKAAATSAPSPRRTEINKNALISVGAFAGVISIAFGIYWLFAPHRTSAVVASRSWSITRELRTRELRHDSAWGAPYGSFNTSCQQRYYGTQNCQPYSCNYHQESYSCRPHDCRCRTYTTTQNLNNGFSKVTTHQRCDTCYDTCSRTVHDTCWHQCPVYRDWCEYDYYAWPVTQTLTTSGTVEPVTEPTLEAGENQRIEQHESYEVTFSEGTTTHKLKPGRIDFGRYTNGSRWAVETTHAGGFEVIEEAR